MSTNKFLVDENWTFEEAEAVCKAYRKENPSASINTPFVQWLALKQLADLKELSKTEKWCLGAAINICARNKLPMPEWVANAYIEAYDQVINVQFDSWDAVFGKPYQGQLNAYKKRIRLRWEVWAEVKFILSTAPETPIDAALFERAGKPFGIGKTLASEYYYEAKEIAASIDEKIAQRRKE